MDIQDVLVVSHCLML